jgi:hypothetical protein
MTTSNQQQGGATINILTVDGRDLTWATFNALDWAEPQDMNPLGWVVEWHH